MSKLLHNILKTILAISIGSLFEWLTLLVVVFPKVPLYWQCIFTIGAFDIFVIIISAIYEIWEDYLPESIKERVNRCALTTYVADFILGQFALCGIWFALECFLDFFKNF